ncbi:MAG: hypothetical protein L0J52_07050 [Corynebacterium casei]|uniref:DUF6928 family protein n=1 Tax=Corynebacterium casei TaxID=160386 RepID=UPI00264824A2|nr:hypothetical protein [Corynebacterium casei]MDN6273717.1 hypothetical protein [Corynebacterium casei]
MALNRAVLTIWYVNCNNPAAVLETEPKADRGYGRKYLAQLNPLFPVTPIGQFPLNRSAQADDHEFYIGGYPGVTVVQTVIHADKDSPLRLSELNPKLRQALPSEDVYACAVNEKEGWAGFAHWHHGGIKRVFSGTRYELMEDSGLPLTFENPYWAGDKAEPLGGISLPFEPRDLMEEAQRHWLGVSIDNEGPDLHVVGYAVDGRPEPKGDTAPQVKSVSQLTSDAAFKLGMGPSNADYDDYESPEEEPTTSTSENFQRFLETSTDFAKKATSRAGSFLRNATDKARDYIADRRNR